MNNPILQANLTWQQARALAEGGQLVRRALWAEWLMYQAGVWFISSDGTFTDAGVVQNYQFQRAEFLAMDWTNAGPDQNQCVGLPGLTATLTLSASTVDDGGSVTATLSITAAQATDTLFIVSATQPGVLSLPQTVTIPAGSIGTTFTINAPPDGTASASFVISASNAFFGVAQAALGLQYVAVPPPPPSQFIQHYSFSLDLGGTGPGGQGLYGEQAISNPFATACQVYIQGYADDYLVVNGTQLGQTGGFVDGEGWWCYTGFLLQPGGSFTIAAYNVYLPEVEYDLQIQFIPQ